MQTMSDFASISDKLALMADPALQQFAQMNKDDPFSLALAVSESNRRRKLRAAQQGDAGMQQQPPVADQEIAQMNAPVMPENVGIGALPAPSMAGMPAGGIAGEEEMEPQTMAGGGMVAFARGGDVERYQSRGLVAPTGVMGAANIPLYMAHGLNAAMDKMRAQGYPVDPRGEFAIAATPEEMAFDEARRQKTLRDNAARAADDARISALVEGRQPPTFGPSSPPSVSALTTALTPNVLPPGAVPEATGAAPAARPPAATAAQPRPSAGPAASTAATVPGVGGLDVAAQYKKALEEAGKQTDPNEADLKSLTRERVKVGEENVTGLEAIQKQFSDISKGKKERLDTKEAELGKLKDQGLGLALLQAGAAMMSTPGGLGVALGKGVKVGSEQYVAGMDRFRSAQEKLSDARDKLEEVEAQRGELSARELFKARNDVKNLELGGREDLIKSRMLINKENRETAMKMVDSQIQVGIAQLKEAGATQRAIMQERGATARANAPSGQERMAIALGGGSLEKGLTRMAEISAGKFDPRKAYSEYLLGYQKSPQTDSLMSYSQFIGQFAIPTTPGNNPAAAAPGTVRERP